MTMAMPMVYDPAEVTQYIERLFLGQTSVLDAKILSAQTGIESQLTQAGAVLQKCQEAGAQLEGQIALLTANAADADARMGARINEVNVLKTAIEGEHERVQSMFTMVRAEFATIRDELAEKDATLRDTINLVEQEVDAGVDRKVGEVREKLADLLVKLGAKFEELEAGIEAKFAGTQRDAKETMAQLQTWSQQFERTHPGAPPGIAGAGFSGKGKGGHLDKKDLAVWKLDDNVDRLRFRHWVEAVENNLEQVHGWDRASEVLDRVRRQEAEVDQDKLEEIIDATYQALESAGEPRLDRGPYEFGVASRMLYTFLLPKINVDMHERTNTIEKKNGFELYRIIYNSVDPIAVNAEFTCDQAIMKLGFDTAGKIKNLKDLYEFRVLLKKKVAEYKKIRGREPDQHLLKNVLYTCMDLDSQQHIADFGLDKAKVNAKGEEESMYKVFCEDIDKRYKLKFGTLELGRSKKDTDDPMGLHAVAPGDEAKQDGPPSGAVGAGTENSLDAFGKGGKGKGKGIGDGRCRVCNGEGHFARDCPSVEPVSPTAVECHGCHGRGHYKGQCPTANPHLKAMGKGWTSKGWGGKGKGDGGKGYTPWGGKGWGGKGKGSGTKGSGKGKGGRGGLAELDVMGGNWNGEWYGDSWPNDWNESSLRSLASLSYAQPDPPKSFENVNRFDAISEHRMSPSTTFEVPLADFVRPNRAPGKTRRLVGHKRSFAPSHSCRDTDACSIGWKCLCEPEAPSKIDDEGVRPVLTPALAPNRETEGVATPAVSPQHASAEDRDVAIEAVISTEAVTKDDSDDWKTVGSSRRGGRRSSDSLKPPSSILKNSTQACSCAGRSKESFCTSPKCRNDQHRNRPTGSVTTGRVHTEYGSPKSTANPRRIEAPLQPKPDISASSIPELLSYLESTLSPAMSSTNADILSALKEVAAALDQRAKRNYWLTDAGQAELLRRYESTSKPPTDGTSGNGLCMFDYTPDSKSMLSSASAAEHRGYDDEWVEVELTADTGACDTVMPRKMCPNIPIRPSLQSLRGMEYEVADGRPIPNLGERHCLMWTESAGEARHINMQVADVHKPLLSLSRCADMGFESRFGRTMGALIDEDSGEVVPLRRKGNLYVLRCWIRAAPFGRPGAP